MSASECSLFSKCEVDGLLKLPLGFPYDLLQDVVPIVSVPATKCGFGLDKRGNLRQGCFCPRTAL